MSANQPNLGLAFPLAKMTWDLMMLLLFLSVCFLDSFLLLFLPNQTENSIQTNNSSSSEVSLHLLSLAIITAFKQPELQKCKQEKAFFPPSTLFSDFGLVPKNKVSLRVFNCINITASSKNQILTQKCTNANIYIYMFLNKSLQLSVLTEWNMTTSNCNLHFIQYVEDTFIEWEFRQPSFQERCVMPH